MTPRLWFSIALFVLLPLAAAPLAAAPLAAAPRTTAPKTVRPTRRCFAVVERSHDTVVIDGGLEEGLFVGTALEGRGDGPDEEPIVVAVLRPGRQRTELDFENNELPLGLRELCRTGERPPSERFLPRRVTPLTELELVLRPYGQTTFSLWTQANAGYRGRDWHVFGQFDLGARLDGSRLDALGAQLFGGWDARAFELSLGAGVGTSDQRPGPNGDAVEGPAFTVLTRLGALDGSSLTVWGTLVASGEPPAAVLGGQLQFALGTGLWLRPRFAVGRAGYQHGELALKVRITGNGRAGSAALLFGAGLAGVQSGVGPSGTLGFEMRL